MNVSPPNENLPGDTSPGRPDEQLAHAHEQIVAADEQLTRLSEQLAKLERDDPRPIPAAPDPQPSQSPPPSLETPSPPSPAAVAEPALAPPSSTARPALRAPAIMLMLAAAVIVAVLVLQLTYDGSAARPPQLASAPSPAQNSQQLAPPVSPAVRVAAAEAAASPAPPQPIVLAQAAPQDTAPATPTALPDQTQLLQAIARDLANLEKNLEQLKATQQQIASDNSKAIGDLKASQDEMKRALAKVSDQSPPRTSQPPAPPALTLRKPEQRAPQARARQRYPREWMYDDW